MCSRSMENSLIDQDNFSLPPMQIPHMHSYISMILQMPSITVWDTRPTALFIMKQCSSFRICSGVNTQEFNCIGRHMRKHVTWVQMKTAILLFALTDPVIIVATIFQQLHQLRLQ